MNRNLGVFAYCIFEKNIFQFCPSFYCSSNVYISVNQARLFCSIWPLARKSAMKLSPPSLLAAFPAACTLTKAAWPSRAKHYLLLLLQANLMGLAATITATDWMLHEGTKGVLTMYSDRFSCLAKHRLSTYLLIVLLGVCFPRQLLKCWLLIPIPVAPPEHSADTISHYFPWAQESTVLFSSLALPFHWGNGLFGERRNKHVILHLFLFQVHFI